MLEAAKLDHEKLEQRIESQPDVGQLVNYEPPEHSTPVKEYEDDKQEEGPDEQAMDLSQTLVNEGLSMSPDGKINLPDSTDAQNHEMIVLQYEQVLQSVNKEFQKLLNRNKELEDEHAKMTANNNMEQTLTDKRSTELHEKEKVVLTSEIQRL